MANALHLKVKVEVQQLVHLYMYLLVQQSVHAHVCWELQAILSVLYAKVMDLLIRSMLQVNKVFIKYTINDVWAVMLQPFYEVLDYFPEVRQFLQFLQFSNFQREQDCTAYFTSDPIAFPKLKLTIPNMVWRGEDIAHTIFIPHL